jgi:hypothetical protein
MHSNEVTFQSHLPNWRGQGMNRLCLRWPSSHEVAHGFHMNREKGLIFVGQAAVCR